MPRAIAPDVTTTTSTPARCSPATSSHSRATTDRRRSPPSWATTEEPSLRTATGTIVPDGTRAPVSGKMSRVELDMLVIGSGPSGQKAAIQAAKLGKRVAVAERKDRLGGVSIHTGTIPSKTLREAVLDQLAERPLDVLDPTRMEETERMALQQLMDRAAKVIGAETAVVREQFRRNMVGWLPGGACFEDDHTVMIEGSDEPIHAERIVIAVGTIPARPATVAFDDRTIIDSDGLLRMDRRVPRSMTVVGAGVIGVEYASMFGSLGTKVTVVDKREHVLGFLDGEIVEAFQYLLRRSNVTFRLRESVEAIESIGGKARIQLASGKTISSETVLYAVGRQGAIEGLGIEKTGLEADKRGRLKVDAEFRTTVPHIFAVGDVAGGGLAATAMEQGRIAALHAFDEPVTTLPLLIPTGVYAIPEIGMVGRTEEELTDTAQPYVAGIARWTELARGLMTGDEHGMLKLLVDPDDRSLLGVHVIGTGRDGARAHRAGGDGAGAGRARLPRHRRLQLPDVRRVLQGRRARRGEPDPRAELTGGACGGGPPHPAVPRAGGVVDLLPALAGELGDHVLERRRRLGRGDGAERGRARDRRLGALDLRDVATADVPAPEPDAARLPLLARAGRSDAWAAAGRAQARVRARGAAAMAAVAGAAGPDAARAGRLARGAGARRRRAASEATARRSRATAPAQARAVPVTGRCRCRDLDHGRRAARPRPLAACAPRAARTAARRPRRSRPPRSAPRGRRCRSRPSSGCTTSTWPSSRVAGRLLGLLLRGGRRRRVERIALPELLGAAAALGEHDRREQGGDHRIVTGVPTGMSFASRRMSALRRRMQPCETRPGMSSGRSVPWIPTKPPAGQSVSVGERALVPKATGPYMGLSYPWRRLRTRNSPAGVGH